jgi:spermidine synthase
VRSRFSLVAALFFVSGATGLLYEVAFSKLLGYVFGATAYAVSAVLSAFMAGMALGAHLGGRNAAKARRPLVAYGALEMIVGLVCLASPRALALVGDAYVSLARSVPGSLALLTLTRTGLTAAVVMVPTMAMGATFPLLSRVVVGERGLPRLYAINTAGGAVGALASAYAILPALGITGTMSAAALANLAIGAVAIVVGRSHAPHGATSSVTAPAETTEDARAARRATGMTGEALGDRLLLGLAFASGFLVFAAEVVETHLLALLIGNSAYAFGLMLAVFLVFLAAGAARVPALARRHGVGALSRGLAAAAIAIGVTLPLWAALPGLFTFAGHHVSSWGGREACRALAAAAILSVPTLWMGSTFPLLLHGLASRPDVASHVGRFTVANTLGTILGSILTGYAILPTLGSQGSLRAVAVAFALAAVACARGPARRPLIAASAAAVVIALAVPSWSMARLTSGANVYFTAGPPPDALEMVREDVHGGVTTVARRGAVRTMYTNGKFQGDDGAEMDAQRRFAHFPSLFVRRFDRALVIGLGTGTTLGTIAQYPWKSIDVAEISPSIVEAARRFYGPQSFEALSDPRVHLDVNDGRNKLLVATEGYDLITMELSSVWFAGASSLYSREFYALARDHLAEDGVLQQWVQLHHLRRRELAVIVHTLRGAFDHVALFVGGAQGILVASRRPLVASAAHLAELEKTPGLVATLAGKHMVDLFDELVTSDTDLDRFVAESTGPDGELPVSTDDDLYLEYATPKGNVLNYDASLRDTLALLDHYRTADPRARHLGP